MYWQTPGVTSIYNLGVFSECFSAGRSLDPDPVWKALASWERLKRFARLLALLPQPFCSPETRIFDRTQSTLGRFHTGTISRVKPSDTTFLIFSCTTARSQSRYTAPSHPETLGWRGTVGDGTRIRVDYITHAGRKSHMTRKSANIVGRKQQ